jgi:hypothetical protein
MIDLAGGGKRGSGPTPSSSASRASPPAHASAPAAIQPMSGPLSTRMRADSD